MNSLNDLSATFLLRSRILVYCPTHSRTESCHFNAGVRIKRYFRQDSTRNATNLLAINSINHFTFRRMESLAMLFERFLHQTLLIAEIPLQISLDTWTL